MRIICIDNNTEGGPFKCYYTVGKIYSAVRSDSYVNKLNIEPYTITDDNGYMALYNFNSDSGVWKNFRKLDDAREERLNQLLND